MKQIIACSVYDTAQPLYYEKIMYIVHLFMIFITFTQKSIHQH